MKSVHNFICCVTVCLLTLLLLPKNLLLTHAYEPIRIEIPIICFDVEDYDNHIYKIKIEAKTENAPMPDSSVLNIDENGNDIFVLFIDEPGTYFYKIYEPKGDNADIEYESREYEAMIFVETNDKDELLPSLSITVDGELVKSSEIHFQDIVLSGGDKKTTTTSTTTTTTSLSTSTNNTTDTITTISSTTMTESITSTKANPIVSFVDSVMTGDTMPLRLLLFILAVATILMFAALLFKKKED